jgi:alginate O-acetyltransferase complex protein AlgI
MLFNSFNFLLFFPIVTIIYFLLPHKLRWIHLLAASCLFYMTFVPVYILILLFTIIVDYIAGIVIENAAEENKRKFLIVSIVANVGVLSIFKYYNFLAENFNGLLHLGHSSSTIPYLSILLPIGLSFHTFQAMSYTLEVYRGNQKAERHFGIYALYVMFYPQLVAGPIERPQNMLHQFHEERKVTYDDIVVGLRKVLFGLFKKTVIADRIGVLIDPVYNDPQHYSSLVINLAVILFIFQLYCDFSGYSDIALGTARVMGFNLMVNFNRPFSSKSITEFWRRWHISLSSWFYDYLFNPLVAILRSWRKFAIAFGLVLTFFLSGLWHGASWNFAIWGVIYGIAITFEFFTKAIRIRLFGMLPLFVNNVISKLITFTFIALTTVFFRAKTIAATFYIFKRVPGVFSELLQLIKKTSSVSTVLGKVDKVSLLVCISLVFLLELVHYMQREEPLNNIIARQPVVMRLAVYFILIFSVYMFGIYNLRQFIYFQF